MYHQKEKYIVLLENEFYENSCYYNNKMPAFIVAKFKMQVKNQVTYNVKKGKNIT